MQTRGSNTMRERIPLKVDKGTANARRLCTTVHFIAGARYFRYILTVNIAVSTNSVEACDNTVDEKL